MGRDIIVNKHQKASQNFDYNGKLIRPRGSLSLTGGNVKVSPSVRTDGTLPPAGNEMCRADSVSTRVHQMDQGGAEKAPSLAATFSDDTNRHPLA